MRTDEAGLTETHEAPAWDPKIAEALYEFLRTSDLRPEKLDPKLEELEQKYDASVYSELINLLCHLRFEPDEARKHWRAIEEHRESMEKRLTSFVDVRVALIDYFVRVNRQLDNPTIIELKLFEQTKSFAYRDELTGLYNYRFLMEYLEREIVRGARYGTPVSLVMVDVDDFKKYNDQFGHEAGNQILAAIAGLLSESVRELDLAVRYGGEEFTIVLPSTTKAGAELVAQRARKTIEDHDFSGEDPKRGGKLTVSMGLATYPHDASSIDGLIRRADRALYMAKADGKNRVQLYGEGRRSFQRVKAALPGQYRDLTGEYEPLITMDISAGGLLFRVERDLPIGSLVEVVLPLPDTERGIITVGRVVRTDDEGPDGFTVGVSFTDIGTGDHALLTDYIRRREPPSDDEDA